MAQTNKTGNGKILKVGAGLAIAAAAVAGAYFLYGKNGAKNRKKIRGWMLKMKGEVLERMEAMPELTEAVYHQIVEEAATRYKPLANVDPKELADTASELRGHWKNIQKQLATKPKKSSARRSTSQKSTKSAAAPKRKRSTKKA